MKLATAERIVAAAPGGVLVPGGTGDIAGVVGICGNTGENGETCAGAGVAAVGLVPDTGT